MKPPATDPAESLAQRDDIPAVALAEPFLDAEIDVGELESLPAPTPWRELCTEIDALCSRSRVLDGLDEAGLFDEDYRALRYLN